MVANRGSLKKTDPLVLPEEVFEFIRELYPFFLHTLTRCELTGPQFFALSSLKHSSVLLDGQPAMLISEMTHTLERVGGYGTSRASMIVVELHSKRLINKMDISPQQRLDLFPETGDVKGKNKVVVIRQEGLDMLKVFNDDVNHLFDELVRSSRLPKRIITYGMSLLPRTAKDLASTARAQSKVLRGNE